MDYKELQEKAKGYGLKHVAISAEDLEKSIKEYEESNPETSEKKEDVKDVKKEDSKTEKTEDKDEDDSKEEKVEISKTVLSKLLERVDDLENAADRRRLENVQSRRNEGKLVKRARISFFEGKAVVGWKKIKDDVYTDKDGRLHEDQVIEIFFEDGKSTETDYRTFSRVSTKKEGEVIGESKDKEGNENYKIQMDDGREYDIDIKFIN